MQPWPHGPTPRLTSTSRSPPCGLPVWVGGQSDAERLTLAAAEFLTPPGIAPAVPSPGRPLGGAAPTAASVVDDLRQLAEAGLSACTLWLPLAAEQLEQAMEWIASAVLPQLTAG